jgi:hypothetical protein
MSYLSTRALMLAAAGGLVASTLAAAGPVTASARESSAKRVLLLSVDGLHQTDLAWYVRTHPSSALAKLVRRGGWWRQAASRSTIRALETESAI